GRIDDVRHVSVSRVLPQTIRIIVDERKPVGLVRIGAKTHRVDGDGKILEAVAGRTRDSDHFVMLGWNSEMSDEAEAANKKRLSIYMDVQKQWQRFELAKRVIAVDMENLRDIKAIISDSGESVVLSLGSEDFGTRLKEGIKHAAGNGRKISRIILDGASPVIVYRD
ncbi:MAG: hypothetical protein OEQ28_14445, partial [Acidobacteriota bacterium]|nr:hypothetical protein [Acidobacteriota bacterium]